jgi:hypothetical protein
MEDERWFDGSRTKNRIDVTPQLRQDASIIYARRVARHFGLWASRYLGERNHASNALDYSSALSCNLFPRTHEDTRTAIHRSLD